MEFDMTLLTWCSYYFPKPHWEERIEFGDYEWMVIARRKVELPFTSFPLTVDFVVKAVGYHGLLTTLKGLTVRESLSHGPYEFVVDARSDEDEPSEERGILPLKKLWPVVGRRYVPSPEKPLFTSLIGDAETRKWFAKWKSLVRNGGVKSLSFSRDVGLGVIYCEAVFSRKGEDIRVVYRKDSGDIRIYRLGEESPSGVITAGEGELKLFLANPSKFISSQTVQ